MAARWILAAAALTLTGAPALAAGRPAKAAPVKVAVHRDWTRVVAATPEGGYRVGNPAATIKLIEYGSLTCPHCAHFAAEAYPKLLQTYVKTGRVNFEFRNFVRDPFDATAALLSRCAGARDYFAVTDAMFAGQGQWTGKIRALPAAEQRRLAGLDPAEGFPQIAEVAGLEAYAAKGGVTPAKAKACLASKPALDKLLDMNRVANETYDLEYTPTFLINGKKVAAADWAELEPLFKPKGR